MAETKINTIQIHCNACSTTVSPREVCKCSNKVFVTQAEHVFQYGANDLTLVQRVK